MFLPHLLPQLLLLALLLLLPRLSLLRPSGFAQMFNNQFAFESAQGNRPDFPIQGQGNDFVRGGKESLYEGKYTMHVKFLKL